MRNMNVLPIAAALTLVAMQASHAAMKEVPYPIVKVELGDTYQPDPAFQKLQKSLADIVAKKDLQALTALVGPSFVWVTAGEVSESFDFGGDPVQNFKVVFGFRDYRKYVDGGVPDGPYWDSLAAFAADKSYEQSAETLVCGPINATIADDNIFESAKQKIGADDSTEWYFAIADANVTANPTGGAQVGRINKIAVPILDTYPSVPEGQSGPPATHLKVLLPSGKSGWVAMSAVLPLVSDRLCYARLQNGDWKIAGYEQVQ